MLQKLNVLSYRKTVSRKVATYYLVSVEMIEHELCTVGVKGGQREVEVVRHGEVGA